MWIDACFMSCWDSPIKSAKCPSKANSIGQNVLNGWTFDLLVPAFLKATFGFCVVIQNNGQFTLTVKIIGSLPYNSLPRIEPWLHFMFTCQFLYFSVVRSEK